MVNTAQSNASPKKPSPNTTLQRKAMMDGLQLVYGAEHQWLTILPILQLAVGCEDFVETLLRFQKDGKDHLHRLESIFETLSIPASHTENKDIEVLIDECYDIIDVTPRNTFIRDAGLIVGMQQVQQYQLASYTSLLAKALDYGDEKVVNLLKIIIHNKQEEEEQLAMAGTSNLLDEII
jgi:ferritin-like metal-binding protein YciE